jgi:hypothetical protein
LPEPAETKPLEQPETKSPADQAAENALRQRLKEMERAEALQRGQQQQPQIAEPPPEPQQQEDPLAHLPSRVQRWYRAHPELATDPERAAQVQYCHHVARREVGQEFTDPYFDRMEAMLFGATNGHARPTPQPVNHAPARHSAPPPRQPARVSGGPYSAPPTREVPSMTTGHAPSRRAPLTRDELEIARATGISPEEYQRNKEIMLRKKQSGEIQ